MTQNRINEEEALKVETAERRQFLRNAMRFGGVALLLTSASRKMLAGSLTLNAQELDAARRAQQTPGAPPDAKRDAERMEASAARPAEMCSGCEGGCTGACTGGCTSCTGCSGCTASCASGCSSSCGGGCQGSCSGMCKGCTGYNL